MPINPWKGKIHLLVDGRVLCGTTGLTNTVPPRQAQHVTCKRCLAALHLNDRSA